MRSLLLICLLVPALVHSKSVLDESFEEFEEDNHEYVEPGEEEDAEKAAFEKDKEHAIKNNADPKSTHKETLYPGISELTDDEFNKEKLGEVEATAEEEVRGLGKLDDPESLKNDVRERAKFQAFKERLASRAAPWSYDANYAGLVTTPKDQGQCGSCASFASTGAYETCMLKAGAPKADLDLSEQWQLNCAYQTTAFPHFRTADGSPTVNGCNGAVSAIYPMWFKDIAGGHGVHERNVPYQGRVGSCDPSTPKWNSGAKVTNTVYAQGSQCNRDYLKNAIAQYGHALIGVFASEQQFKDYESGVLETCSNYYGANHAVLAVGYGNENGRDYWLVKNSWGTNWGENGFVKIAMGTCAIETSGCSVTECSPSGATDSAPPPPPPPPASATCDMSRVFSNLNNYRGTLNLNFGSYGYYSQRVQCTDARNCQCLDVGSNNCCQALCGASTCPPW